MRNAAFTLFTIIMLTAQLPASTRYSIGVKPGDWIRYDQSFYQKTISHQDLGMNGTQLIVFDSLIQFLETNGTMTTFNRTDIYHDGSIRWRTTYVADPTQPYDGHPEIAVHHYVIPSNLSAGSPLPEPILFMSNVGNVTRPAWTQVINETRTTYVLGADRETNYIHWTLSLENGLGVMSMERECLFDRRTGVVLSHYNNYTRSSVDSLGLVDSYTEVHQYRVKDTNMWDRSALESWGIVAVIALIFISISFIVFHGLKPRG
jgi:hypothetical protein